MGEARSLARRHASETPEDAQRAAKGVEGAG
jgi:hypothetical protein